MTVLVSSVVGTEQQALPPRATEWPWPPSCARVEWSSTGTRVGAARSMGQETGAASRDRGLRPSGLLPWAPLPPCSSA